VTNPDPEKLVQVGRKNKICSSLIGLFYLDCLEDTITARLEKMISSIEKIV